MLRYFGILCLLCIGATYSYSQKEGDVWLLGYANSDNPNEGVFQFDFSTGDLILERMVGEKFYIFGTSSSICDSEGEPLLWTNGMEIRGRNHAFIADTISYLPDDFDVWPNKPSYWLWYYDDMKKITRGFPIHNSSVILENPGNGSEIYVIYHLAEYNMTSWDVSEWRFAKIKLNIDGSYEMQMKDQLIQPRKEWYGRNLNVVRHANGRDWWLFVFELESYRYHSFLLDPDGLRLYRTDSTTCFNHQSIGRANVSFKGNYLIRNENLLDDNYTNSFAPLFTIDRCEGKLNFEVALNIAYSPFGGGAFSPSEQYLYLDQTQDTLWQFDLWAEDINASRTLVGVQDGFVQPGWFRTTFGPMMQTPDGRIYIVPTTGSSSYLHVIDRPNLPGKDSKLLQHHVNIGVHQGRSSPNNANFRLGPIDDSPCDTLGINNLATSRWRWEVNDSVDPLTVRFTDLSFFEPDTWEWDFDDQTTADIAAPLHTFPDYGLYHVCQTVSNEFNTDSTCRWIELLPKTAIKDPKESSIYVSPNPFQESLRLQFRENGYTNGTVTLTNLNGVTVYHAETIPIPITLTLPDLQPGMYICTVVENNGSRSVMKVVKQ